MGHKALQIKGGPLHPRKSGSKEGGTVGMAGAAMEQREFFGVFGEGDHGSRPKAFGSAGEVRCVSGVQGRIGYGARNCQEAM